MWLFVPPALLILVFPDGRPPARTWRWVGYGLVIVPLLFQFPAAADPTPFDPPYAEVPHLFEVPVPWAGMLGIVGVFLLPVFLGLLVASVASMVVRYRRASATVPYSHECVATRIACCSTALISSVETMLSVLSSRKGCKQSGTARCPTAVLMACTSAFIHR